MASRPLEGRYVPMLAVALFALIPYILVASGATLYRDQVLHDLHATPTALSVIAGLSTAGYAFGALLAGDLVQRFSQRRVFFACEAVFVVGWLLSAVCWGTVSYGTGRVLAGFATGLLLVAALPPVIRRFPAGRLPLTAAFVNVAFFGAVAAGPVIGGAVAAAHAWRAVYGGFAALGLVSVVIAWLSLPLEPPPNPEMRFDRSGLVLGFVATALLFWGSGELASNGFGTVVVAAPLAVGLAALVALLLIEYHKREPLAPIRMMWTTFPLIGTLVAMIGGGVFVAFAMLTVRLLTEVGHRAPLTAGLTFWPQVAGALVTAILLGFLFRTRYLPVLIACGMVALIGGGVLLAEAEVGGGGDGLLLAGVGLLGLGAGATVSPALFLAGFSLPTRMLGRIFALIELVRSLADFILAPVILRVAKISATGGQPALAGIHEGMWITLLIAISGSLLCVLIYVVGKAGLPRPSLEAWVRHNKPAIPSPPLAAALRRQA